MKTLELDWSVLRGSLIILSLSVAVTATIVWMSMDFREGARSTFDQGNSRFQTQSRKYLAVDEEEQIIREFLPKYQVLGRRGIVGDERRLNWTEALRNVSQNLRLSSLRYSIQPRETYDPEFYNQRGAFQLYASSMNISLGMLHEGDLLRFLDALRHQALGVFTVEGCSIRRLGTALKKEPDSINLQAECELTWVTLNKPDQGDFR